MSKKHNPTLTQPRPVKVADRAGDELIAFPAERNILTGRQREIPNPAAALANLGQPSERARLRAAAEPAQPAPTVREELEATRTRPLDAPMAHRIGSLPDPFAQQVWAVVADSISDPVRSWWDRWQFTLAFTVWSVACFVLGTLA